MRRDSKDQRWQETKRRVWERDKQDRMVKVLSLAEYRVLQKNAGSQISILDPAHYLPVGKYPQYCYWSANVILLNRYSHECIGHGKNPVTGEHISEEEIQTWWERILKGDPIQYNYLKYKELL